jgi:hypothetical protein
MSQLLVNVYDAEKVWPVSNIVKLHFKLVVVPLVSGEIKSEITQARQRWDEAISFQEREVILAFAKAAAKFVWQIGQ